ncbi:MAG: hypothetical protein KDD70_11810, partial [Bdellovibrionales bacterium]|nr:hypothetical protein [Bdellovibrionales bacterium]
VPMAALLLDLTDEESEALLASLDLTITHALNEKTRRLEEDMKWGVRLIEGAEKSVKRLGYISGVPNDFGQLASEASKNIRKLLPEERGERSAEALLESCTKFREIFTPVRASLESIRDHLRGVNVLSEELEKVVKAVKDKELFPATLRPVEQLIREAKPFLGPSGISDPLATVLLDFEKRQKPERTIIADVPEGSA